MMDLDVMYLRLQTMANYFGISIREKEQWGLKKKTHVVKSSSVAPQNWFHH